MLNYFDIKTCIPFSYSLLLRNRK